jgi:hypothetical protein
MIIEEHITITVQVEGHISGDNSKKHFFTCSIHFNSAIAFSITILSITILSITILSITILSIKILSITTTSPTTSSITISKF